MVSREEPSSAELRIALIKTLTHSLRMRIYCSVVERPGATISQIAARTSEPNRKVRHQVEWLTDAGLVSIDEETPRRNTRERHYRAHVQTLFLRGDHERLTGEERRRIATSMLSYLTSDLRRAIRGGTIGSDSKFSMARFPGELDELGFDELTQIMERATGEIESTMIRSAKRLQAASEAGVEVAAGLFSIEMPDWAPEDAQRHGPRPSMWLP